MLIPDGIRMSVVTNHRFKMKMPLLQVFFTVAAADHDADRISIAIVPEVIDGLITQLQCVQHFLIAHPYPVTDAEIDSFNAMMERLMQLPEDQS